MAVVGSIEIDTIVNTKKAHKSLAELEKELKDLDREFDETMAKETYVGKGEDLHKINEKMAEVRKQISELGDDSGKTSDSMVKSSAKMLGWAAAITAVTGIISLGFASVNKYLEKNIETSNKLKSAGQAIKNFADGLLSVLGDMLGPYIEKFVNWLLRLLGYINVFVKTISGGKIDMTKKMDKNEKSVKKTSGAMKELNKQMAKFDEANKLSDNSKLDGGGADLDDAVNFEMPELDEKWVKRIEDFAQKVADLFGFIKDHIVEILSIIGAIKIAKWINGLGSLIGVAGAAGTGAGGVGLVGLATALLAVAAALSVFAAGFVWGQVVEEDKKLTDELMNSADIGEAFYKTNKKVIDAMKKSEKGSETMAKGFRHNNEGIKSATRSIIGWTQEINETDSAVLWLNQGIHGNNSILSKSSEHIEKNIDNLETYITTMNEEYKQGKLTEEQKKEYIETLKWANEELKDENAWTDKNTKAYDLNKQAIKLTSDALKELGVETDSQKVNFSELTKGIDILNKAKIDKKTMTFEFNANTSPLANGLTSMVRNVASNMQNAFNNLNFNALKQTLVNQLSSIFPNIQSSIKRAFGLAKGGIINLPGAGVPLASGVIGGERAPEGVIPLTDSQQMEILGEAIGKYITINASITNTMNGRVISRELKKINSENDFANNR